MFVARFLISVGLCGLLLAQPGYALQQDKQQQEKHQQAMQLMDSPMDNLLPIDGQRFRIDSGIEEITLLFFREPNSPPLILIKPDGSKWYDSDYPLERVTWYTDPKFDMIKIVDPEPGPWQVAGRVDKNNRAIIVSDVSFKADPLPQQLFENERLKVEGTLYNGNEPVTTSRFGETVILDVLFVSSNNPDYDNFGSEPSRVAEFSDDGQGYDEQAGDGTFTGRFKLDVVPGEYIPSYQLQTPLYERSFEDEAVVVEHQPITFDFNLAEQAGADNGLVVQLDEQLIIPSSVAINGSISYPNGEQRQFSVTKIDSYPHIIPLDNLTYGKHLIELNVFATSRQQREIELSFANLSFISVEPIPELTAEQRAQQARQEAAREAALQQQQRAAEEQQLFINLVIVIVINVLLISAAVFAVWWQRRKRNPAVAQKSAQKKVDKANKKAAKKSKAD